MSKVKEETEYVIAVIQGDQPNERMVFASRNSSCQRPIILRQESFSPDVGWFTQNSIAMTRRDMALLRSAMGGSRPAACQATASRIEPDRQPAILPLRDVPVAS